MMSTQKTMEFEESDDLFAEHRQTRTVTPRQAIKKVGSLKNPAAEGKSLRDAGRDTAADNNQDKMQQARRIARDLAKNGPISIDDVTDKLREKKIIAANPSRKHPMKWLGAVFATSEWQKYGETVSRRPKNHARSVSLWVTKEWARKNAGHGIGNRNSAYVLSRVYREFQNSNPDFDPRDHMWMIGTLGFNKELEKRILANDNSLYGIKVDLIDNSAGALLV